MYSRYLRNGGFFEPEYEPQFTYAHERKQHEEEQENLRLEQERRDAELREAELREAERHEEGASREDSREARLRQRRERLEKEQREREKRREERREDREKRTQGRASRRSQGGTPKAAPRQDAGRGGLDLGRLRKTMSSIKPGGLLDGLGLDNGDVLLIVLLLYLYEETQDPEMLILLGLLFLV